MAETMASHQETIEAANEGPTMTGAKAVIDTTWSVLSFVLSSEAEWPGYDAELA